MCCENVTLSLSRMVEKLGERTAKLVVRVRSVSQKVEAEVHRQAHWAGKADDRESANTAKDPEAAESPLSKGYSAEQESKSLCLLSTQAQTSVWRQFTYTNSSVWKNMNNERVLTL